MRKKSIQLFFVLGLIVLLSKFSLVAQQEAHFSQYYQNPYFFNPAAGGMTSTIQFDMGFRRQWAGIDGAPVTTYLTGHSEITYDRNEPNVIEPFNTDGENVFSFPSNKVGKVKHVVGGKFINDQIGPFVKNSIMGSYAYHLRFSKTTMLGLGLGLGLSNYGINPDKVVLYDQDDFDYMDFFGRTSNQTILDASAGLTLYGEHYAFGVSSAQLLNNEMVIDQVVTSSTYGRHWAVFGMYQFDLNSVFIAEPHFMVHIVGGAPLSLNIGSRILFKNRFWGNVAYRIGDAVNVGFGVNILKNFRFGYSFDFATGRVQSVSSNVHELHLGIILGNSKPSRGEIIFEEDIEE